MKIKDFSSKLSQEVTTCQRGFSKPECHGDDWPQDDPSSVKFKVAAGVPET